MEEEGGGSPPPRTALPRLIPTTPSPRPSFTTTLLPSSTHPPHHPHPTPNRITSLPTPASAAQAATFQAAASPQASRSQPLGTSAPSPLRPQLSSPAGEAISLTATSRDGQGGLNSHPGPSPLACDLGSAPSLGLLRIRPPRPLSLPLLIHARHPFPRFYHFSSRSDRFCARSGRPSIRSGRPNARSGHPCARSGRPCARSGRHHLPLPLSRKLEDLAACCDKSPPPSPPRTLPSLRKRTEFGFEDQGPRSLGSAGFSRRSQAPWSTTDTDLHVED